MFDEVIQVFGGLTLATVLPCMGAVIVLFKKYKEAKECLKEKILKEHDYDEQINNVIQQVGLYPKWRAQSVEIQKQLSTAIEGISKQISDLVYEVAENDAITRRYRILRFNDELLHGVKHTKEHFDQILEDIARYEAFCEAHEDFVNSKAVMASSNIKRKYQERLDKGDFLR